MLAEAKTEVYLLSFGGDASMQRVGELLRDTRLVWFRVSVTSNTIDLKWVRLGTRKG